MYDIMTLYLAMEPNRIFPKQIERKKVKTVRKRQARLRALRMRAMVILLSILGFFVFNGATAFADTPPEIEKVIYAVNGATADGSHPANSIVDGTTLVDWVDSPIRPLSMVADNKAAEEKLVNDVVPDADGECNLAGISSGSIVAYNAAARVASKCRVVNLELIASPVGAGAVGQLIPANTPLVEIPTQKLPDNVVVTRKGSNRDGINSCKSLADALECGAGALVYHYGLFGGGHSVGPKMSYVGEDGYNYEISNDASGVSVIAGEAVKLVNPQFQGWSPEQQAQWDAVFPAGTPGFGQSGTQSLGNGAGLSAVPNLTDMFGNLIQSPVGQSTPQAKAIPAMGPQAPGQLLPDVVQAGVSVTKAATSVAGVAAAAQSGNPMGLLQAPQALNNVTTAIGDVQQVFTDLSAGTPALGTTPAVAEVAPAAEPAPAPEFIPEPVQAMVEEFIPEPVQAVVDQFVPSTFDQPSSEPVYSAPAPDPIVQVQSFVNDVVAPVLGGGAPAPADAPAPVAPNPVGDLAALGNALFGGH